MLTPRRLVTALRVAAVISGLLLTILLLGPFQGLEQVFYLTDKEAHVAAFFAVTIGLFAIAPRWRRSDLAIAALAFGVLIEVGQGLTGRSMSLSDLMADGLGVSMAVLPGMIERLRIAFRSDPYVSFRDLRARDRRKDRRRGRRSSAGVASPATVRVMSDRKI